MISQSLRDIQSSWRLVIICALVAWVVSLSISYGTMPEYRATATFLIFPNASLTSSRDVVTSLDTLDKQTVTFTYADIMGSNRVFAEAVKLLKLDPLQASKYNFRAEVQPNTNILALIVEGPDPDMAVTLANNMGQAGINYIKGIYQVFDITFLDKAVRPELPFHPTPLRTGAIWAGGGLLVGIVLALLKESIRVPLETLRERAITDKESGAFNIRYFKRAVERELSRSGDTPLSIALLELEGLQDVVDALPAAVLSDLMHKITAVLRNQLRGNDIVARWSKANFAILLPSTPGLAATRTLERLQQVLSAPVEIGVSGDKLNLSPCVGLSSRLQGEVDEEAFFRRAEAALEKARTTGKLVYYYLDGQQEG